METFWINLINHKKYMFFANQPEIIHSDDLLFTERFGDDRGNGAFPKCGSNVVDSRGGN